MSKSHKFDQDLQKHCQQWVDRLGADLQGLKAAVITSADGFEVASYFQQDNKASRIAAMASSMAALADAICAEGALHAHRSVLVQAEKGNFLVFQIPHDIHPFALCLISDERAVLGQMLHFGTLCAKDLAQTA